MPRPFTFRLPLLGILALAAVGAAATGCSRRPAPPAAAPAPARQLTFNESIEPILSENCYQCHGPDPGGRKAGLRLDRAEFAFAPHEKSGPAIVPHDPDHSPLVHRVESKDVKQMMPPLEAHKTLKPEQIALLRRWIREGAGYEEHWSFIPPHRPAVPATARKDWGHGPIDAFILSRLEREKLEPAPEADPYSLLRRVSYDLTGLPPSPEETAAFAADRSSDAYEKAVDRLLASPRYGEHRAHYWLDAARYGDTHGLYKDNYRAIWPFRDYVIKAYNENKPFDQFAREQLAGDLLPASNVDQLVASAFIRSGVTTEEGGSILQELKVNNQRERVETFGAVFLGLTTGCAVCHDHKFDPITQKDFYRLTAFFNNLTELASDDSRSDWPPNINVPQPENRAAYNAALAKRAAVKQQITERRLRARELVTAWLAAGSSRPVAVAEDGLALRLRFDESKGATFANTAPGAALKAFTATGGSPSWGEDTWLWPTLRLELSTALTLGDLGDFEKDQAFSVATWMAPHQGTADGYGKTYGAVLARTSGGRGWELFQDRGRISFRLIHSWPGNVIFVQSKDRVVYPGRWDHLLVTYDGSGRADGVHLYVGGKPIAVTVVTDHLRGSIRTLTPLELGREHPESNLFRQTGFQDLRLYARAIAPAEALRLPVEDYVAEIVRRPVSAWSEDEFKAVSDFYFTQRDAPMSALAAEIPVLNAEINRLGKGGDLCIVSEESPRLAYADILTRGVYTARTERVRPGVPHFLPQVAPEAELNRRTLADWVVSPGNPLTARVAVNRMWGEIFGTGLVSTAEDFGLMGERPSHPELLEWLAVDFRESGWNVKRLYKQLVMSAAYRQSARASAALLDRDPANRLIARGPRFRMDAEMVRDTALAASGLLIEKVGGPSVKPYQPPGVWESGGLPSSDTLNYKMDHGAKLYRRSLYTFWKRLATMPNMEALDQPNRVSACTQRLRTDTPLQALVVMNDPQWLEAARNLAERVVREAPTTEARLDFLGRLLLSRPWTPEDQALLQRELAEFRATYADQVEAATKLVTVGESKPDPKIPAIDLAPWMLVASTALNLDATLNK